MTFLAPFLFLFTPHLPPHPLSSTQTHPYYIHPRVSAALSVRTLPTFPPLLPPTTPTPFQGHYQSKLERCSKVRRRQNSAELRHCYRHWTHLPVAQNTSHLKPNVCRLAWVWRSMSFSSALLVTVNEMQDSAFIKWRDIDKNVLYTHTKQSNPTVLGLFCLFFFCSEIIAVNAMMGCMERVEFCVFGGAERRKVGIKGRG